MQLPLLDFTRLIQTMAAAVQGGARPLIDLTVGSVLRAVLEASASVALWMQWLILLVLRTTRAGTSAGADLDSWMADFGVVRLSAVAATGQVTLSRLTPTAPAFVPLGAQARTADGTQLFAVVADATNPAYSAAAGGYTIGAGVASLAVPVAAIAAGAAGNVRAGGISLLATAIAGIDAVANASPLVNGADPEPDAALRARFVSFINSRSRATVDAIVFAVTSLGQNLTCIVLPANGVPGAITPAAFLAVVDDGSGAPPSTTLAAAARAIDAVRPLGTSFAVQGPAVVPVSVALSVTTTSTANHQSVAASVSLAIAGYLAHLPIGVGLPVARVAQLAFATDPSVSNVTNVSLNGSAQDVAIPANAVIKPAAITVT